MTCQTSSKQWQDAWLGQVELIPIWKKNAQGRESTERFWIIEVLAKFETCTFRWSLRVMPYCNLPEMPRHFHVVPPSTPTMRKLRLPRRNFHHEIAQVTVCIQRVSISISSYWSHEKTEKLYSSKGPDFLCFLSCRPLPLAPWPSKSPHICTQRCYIHHLQLPKDSLDCNMGASPLQNTLLTAKVGRVNKDLSIRIDIKA